MTRHLPPVLCLFLFCLVPLEIFTSGSSRDSIEARIVFTALLAVLTPFAAWPLFPTHEGANKALLPSGAVCFIAVLIYMSTQANFVLMVAALAVGIGATAFAHINGLTPNSRDHAPGREIGSQSSRQGGYGEPLGRAGAAALGVGAMTAAGAAYAMADENHIEPSVTGGMLMGDVDFPAMEMEISGPIANVDGTPMMRNSLVDILGRAFGDTSDMTGNSTGSFGFDSFSNDSFSNDSFGSGGIDMV